MKNCLNCGEKLIGKYCYQCGQEASVARYSMGLLLKDFYKLLVRFDSDFRRTFMALTFKPGIFIQNYLQGKRKGFISPIKYLFIILAVNITFTFILNKPALEPVIIDPKNNIPFFNQYITLLTNLVFILLMIPFAVGMMVMNKGEKYTFVEYFCFLVYVMSQSVAIFIIIQIILKSNEMVLKGPYEGLAWSIEFALLYFWSYLTFFGDFRDKILPRMIFSFIIGGLIIALTLVILGFFIFHVFF